MGKKLIGLLKTLLATIFCASAVNLILLWGSDILIEFGKLFSRLYSWLQNKPIIGTPLLLLIGWIIQQELRGFRERKKGKDEKEKEKEREAERKFEEIQALEEEFDKIEKAKQIK